MSVRFFYVDESHDKDKFVLTAISVRHSKWRECFQAVKDHRLLLKREYGIRLYKEIHSYKFVRGKGRSISDRILSKWQRSRVYFSLLNNIADLPHVRVFNVCLDVKGRKDPQLDAWDRMINRIQRYCEKVEETESNRRSLVRQHYTNHHVPDEIRDDFESSISNFHPRAIIIADEGRELEITRALRKMNVFNPIPSRFGSWGNGQASKNIVTKSIIEDVFFKQSHRSYFVQLADVASYALLKREVAPTPVIEKYGIHEMWDQTIQKVAHKPASKYDPHGIVRN